MSRSAAINAEFLDAFRQTVDNAAGRLTAVSVADASRRPAPNKWSSKEIIGHLIDSAVHNHARFVQGQLQDDLVFAGYDQEAWVRVERHQDRAWPDLVRVWRDATVQIAHVMEAADADAVGRPRSRHNLHEIAFHSVPADQPATLAYLMRDYVDHLNHHLAQVWRLVAKADDQLAT